MINPNELRYSRNRYSGYLLYESNPWTGLYLGRHSNSELSIYLCSEKDSNQICIFSIPENKIPYNQLLIIMPIRI